MRPVAWIDLVDLVALKGNPRSFAAMLGGVRSPSVVVDELAADIVAWSACGFGMWTVRSAKSDRFVGLVGLHDRSDGRGIAIRFALLPEDQGFGYATEAAGAALRFGHQQAGLIRIVAVARVDNFASRTIIGTIGMRFHENFWRDSFQMLLYESLNS